MAVTTKPPHNHHNSNLISSIPIDMSTLSHSELQLLSLLSSTTTKTTTTTTTTSTTPQFSINPSLSTHQQTYSLSPHHPRRHLLNHHDPSESNLIVSFLRHNLKINKNNLSIDIVNKHGVVVDLDALEKSDFINGGPFENELMSRAKGKLKEDELLQMLANIDGNWCSRRRKRRIIDASLLGDALPLGWKVIVALRRKGGHFYPYCRRYISPTGEQFLSCKEVSSYLKSYFGINDAEVMRDGRAESRQLQIVDSVDNMCMISENGNSMLELPNSTMPDTSCLTVVQQKDASILGIDDLADVPVCDLYECHSCNLNFDEKDKYLQHVFLLHEKTTRRYTLDSFVENNVINTDKEPQSKKRKKRRGSSVGDGVIMKDGKYGCQFCDKVFEERRRYLGHVGNHVKGSIKTYKNANGEEINHVKSPGLDTSPTTNISKMDALIEIAQSSIQDLNMLVTGNEPASLNKIDQFIVTENLQNMDVDLETENPSDNEICLGEDESCDKVAKMSVIDKEVDSMEYEEEDTTREKSFSLEMGEKSNINGNNNDPFSCTNEGELETFVREDENLLGELNTLSMISKRSTFDEENNGHIFTSSVVNFEKDSSSRETTRPIVENGMAENASITYESTIIDGEEYSDEPLGTCNNHHLHSNGRATEHDFCNDKIESEYVQKQGTESALRYDGDEFVNVFGENHDSGCIEPQISLNSSTSFDEIFEKAGQNICSLDQNLETVNGLEYMKLDVIEPQMYKYSGMSREDSISFYEVSMEMENNIGLEIELDNSLTSPQPEIPQETNAKCMTTTICVWCGVEFSHEIGEVELQPDSVGFMCPACRAKISKQFNELESNFPEFSIF